MPQRPRPPPDLGCTHWVASLSGAETRVVTGMAYVMMLLIAIAVAFPAGWLVCRAWLAARGQAIGDGVSQAKHHALLQAQRTRYRAQVQRVVDTVRRHENARDQLKTRLAEVGNRLDSSQKQNEALRAQFDAAREEAEKRPKADAAGQCGDNADNALSLLQIERDELRARVHRLEEEAKTRAAKADDDTAAADRRAERGALREKLAAAEHRRHELETRLADREVRIAELEQTVESWKQRVIPLTRQVQSYREAVRKLQKGDSTESETPQDDSPVDSLQQIKGIGPALERRLNAQGIRRFAQIAALKPVELANLADRLAISPTLPERDKWIDQARALADASTAEAVTV